jgi:hypothetical protein
MRPVLPAGFTVFVVGGLLSGMLGLSNLAGFLDRATRSGSESSVSSTTPQVQPAPHPIVTPSATLSTVLKPPGSSVSAPADSGPGLSFLYVIGGNLWVTERGAQFQLTQGATISQPVLTDDGLAFVERQRNSSDIWLASSDAPMRPITRNASPIVSQNHWATQPVFLPGKQRLFVVGDFNKSATGPGNLAVWELSPQEQTVVQITQPPAYAGGDQDVTLNPEDPHQIIFTRYAYAGTQLVEQLQWMDVTTNTGVALSQADQATRQASYSPEGGSVAFIQAGDGTNQDLWVARLQVADDGAHLEDPRRVAAGVIANPVWSPDGSELTYLALTKDQFQVWSLAVRRDGNGSVQSFGQPRQITNGPDVDATSRPVYMTREQTARVRDWLTMPSAHS